MNILIYMGFFVTGFLADYPPLFLKEINFIRAHGCQCGEVEMPAVDPLIWNETLSETSRRHAKDMEDNDFFSHVNQINQDVGMRADSIYYEWAQIGENIAKGYLSEFDVLRAWLDSPSHCEMIMFSDITEMGARRVGDYWVVNFGRPFFESKKDKRKKTHHKNHFIRVLSRGYH